MKTFKPLLAYNCCQIFSIIYSLFVLELNQLNPSKHLPKVIAITFGFQLTSLLVYQTLAANKWISQNFNLLQMLTILAKSVVFYYAAIVLLGAPILSAQVKTLNLSILLTILTTLPVAVVCKPNNMIANLMNCLNRFNDLRPDIIITKTSLLTLVGGWLGAFFIVLDWMQPWQEWPITICLGAMITNLLCNTLALIIVSYKGLRKIK